MNYARASAVAHQLLIAVCVAELAVLTLGTWVWHQEGREPSVAIWLIRTVPVVVFLPGVFKGNPRTCIWLCFVILLYFTMAVTEVMSPHGSWLSGIEVATSVLIFISAMLFVRWRSKAQPQ